MKIRTTSLNNKKGRSKKKNTGKQNSEMNECKMQKGTIETDREPENGRTNGKSAKNAGSE